MSGIEAALERRFQGYAAKLIAEHGVMADPSDELMARVFATCARVPRPAEYPAIRHAHELMVETCEDRGWACCDAFPPGDGPGSDGWYDEHVAAWRASGAEVGTTVTA